MEYKKLSGTGGSWISKISIVISLLTIFLCGGLIYMVYNLQLEIFELERRYQLQEKTLKRYSEKISDLQTDLQILNQSITVQWNTDTYNWDYFDDEYDNASEYDDLDPDMEKQRLKREVLMRTADGVPVNSESYEDTKKNNKTSTETSTTSQAPPAYVRKSRVMRMEDKSKAFRRVIRKPLVKSGDLMGQEEYIQEIPIRRRHRQRRVDSSEPFFRFRPAIHLSGDVYVSNGWSHHEADHYKNWSRESWVRTLGMDQYFFLNNGELRIADPGLYLVYAQVLYFDEHDTNGFYVYKNDDIILQCTTTSHSNHRVRKSNTCYTAGISHLNEGDRLRVHDIESYRYSIFRPGKSFFGAIKLSDVRKNV